VASCDLICTSLHRHLQRAGAPSKRRNGGFQRRERTQHTCAALLHVGNLVPNDDSELGGVEHRDSPIRDDDLRFGTEAVGDQSVGWELRRIVHEFARRRAFAAANYLARRRSSQLSRFDPRRTSTRRTNWGGALAAPDAQRSEFQCLAESRDFRLDFGRDAVRAVLRSGMADRQDRPRLCHPNDATCVYSPVRAPFPREHA
jgi:hypothetical protein